MILMVALIILTWIILLFVSLGLLVVGANRWNW
jgi:hypothetical protein